MEEYLEQVVNLLRLKRMERFVDAMKEEHLKELKYGSDKVKVITTFHDDTLKEKHLGELEYDSNKVKVITTFRDDTLKEKHLGELEYDSNKVKVITTFRDDALKEKHLGELDDDYYKTEVITTFRDDALKEKHLGELEDDEFKAEVITTFRDDALKEEHLGELKDDEFKAEIITTFQDEAMKAKSLGKLEEDRYKTKIMTTFRDDALKEEHLGELENDGAKTDVINSFRNDEMKAKSLGKLEIDEFKVRIIKRFHEDTLKEKYLEELKKDYSKAEIIRTFHDDEMKEKYLGELDDDRSKATILASMKDKTTIIRSINDQNFALSAVFNYLEHLEHEEKEEILNGVSNYVIEAFVGDDSTKKEHGKTLSTMFSPQAILYLKNTTIQEICSWDNKIFDKLTHLLVCDKLDISTINNIVSSLRQKDFSLNKPNITQVFSVLKNTIIQDDYQQIQSIISQIGTQVNFRKLFEKDSLNTYGEKYGYNQETMVVHFDQFLMKLCMEIKNQPLKDREKIYQCLHDITNNYIEYSRNQYVGEFMDNYVENLKIPKVPNKNKLLDHVLEVESVGNILELLKQIDRSKINETGLMLLNDQKLLEGCIKFKKNPLIETDLTVKKQLKTFNRLMEQLYIDKKLSRFANELSILEPNVDSIVGTNVLDVLVNLDLPSVENLLKQDKIYTQLSKIMKQYKLLSWGTTFDKLLDTIELSCDASTVAMLINESDQIVRKLETEKQQNIVSLLTKVSYFNSDELERRALGNENYGLLKANPRPNAASMSLSDRMERVSSCLKIMKDREFVDVPPLDCEMGLDNQKKIRTVVGNFTDPRILTLGERTGACMRIGGVGSSLFDFCLENEAGFHVEFMEPNTDKFISRVSGFINGNTVFLNELRNSVNENYTDQEVIETCKKVANYFIDQTTNTKYPIDNVVISNQYAMNQTNDKMEQLPVNDIKEGLPNFYSDVSSTVIVLATREKEKAFADVMLDPTKTNRYYCLRTKPIFYNDSEIAQHKVNQLITREAVIDKRKMIIEYKDCTSAIVGEDWYLYEDKEGQIHSHIMKDLPESKQKQAVEEVKIASMKYDEVIEEPVEIINQTEPLQHSFVTTNTSIEENVVEKQQKMAVSKRR